jgi:hypothetical protein
MPSIPKSTLPLVSEATAETMSAPRPIITWSAPNVFASAAFSVDPAMPMTQPRGQGRLCLGLPDRFASAAPVQRAGNILLPHCHRQFCHLPRMR